MNNLKWKIGEVEVFQIVEMVIKSADAPSSFATPKISAKLKAWT